jgi:hypothetical protein
MLNIKDIEKRLELYPEPKEVKEIRENILTSFNNLEFQEEPHKYFLHNDDGSVTELPSVSGVTHKYANEFDDIGESEKYALKHGGSPEYWRDQWKFKNNCATLTGTLVHEFGESLAWIRSGHPENICESCKLKYIKDKGWLIPTREKEKAVVSFWDDMPETYHVILPEAKVYNLTSVQNPYAGTFDLLMYYDNKEHPEKSGCILMDYKTNEKLYNDYNEKIGRCLKPNFNDLIDCSYSMYILQLNLYQLALENIGIKILARRIIWLKPDETYELISVPNIIDRIKKEF